MSDKPTERELTDDERQEIVDELATAQELVLRSTPKDADADAVVLALRDLVDSIRDDKRSAPSDLDETGFLAGALLGQAIVDNSRFEWVHLTYASGFESIGLVAWDRSFVLFPFHYMYELLADEDKDNTISTLWEMIRGEQGPGIVAGAYLPLS